MDEGATVVLSLMMAGATLTLPAAASAAPVTRTTPTPGHPAFRNAVREYYSTAHPGCGMQTDAALAGRIAVRDRKFDALSARIARGLLARALREALANAARRQAAIAAVADCAAPTIAGSRVVFGQSLAARKRLETVWRAATRRTNHGAVVSERLRR